MATWIYTFKNTSAENVNRDLRILPSKDGEMSVYADNNQIIISDWTSNLNRIADVLKEIDVKTSPEVAKIVEASKKERMERRKQHAKTEDSAAEMMPMAPMKKANSK
jgi:general secretion pathway protein D